ncbi:hypothetical protein [Thiocapsa marina]|uniref:Uncharacterized protein n=1 Tax=Thiocapsa marina 5811 TaxID=768671 RepID=F9UI78_9GAMM|nr:hypothetical protein [Thiocapsa marina]EGV16083.1 hypothetical protein ThimaDRAFT_4631 [Thiocapsa marina 5811]
MAKICIEIDEIPHGHAMSFKKGLSDGILDMYGKQQDIHATNKASYRKGVAAGTQLKEQIASLVKK